MAFYVQGNDNPLDPLLPVALLGADNHPEDFVADRVCPAVEGLKSGQVKVLADGVTTDVPSDGEALAHAQGADAAMRTLSGFTTIPYTTTRYSESFILPDDVAMDTRTWRDAQDASAMAARMAAIKRFSMEAGVSVSRLKMGRELRFNTLFGTKANWHASSLTLTLGNRWSQPGSNPAKNIQAAASATRADSCVMSWDRWLDLQTNESFLSGLSLDKDSSALTIGDLMGKFERFGIEHVIIGRAAYTSNGGANETFALNGWTWVGFLGLMVDGSGRLVIRPELVNVQMEGNNPYIQVSRIAALRVVYRDLEDVIGQVSVPVPREALDSFRVAAQYEARKLGNLAVLSHREGLLKCRKNSGFLIEEA